MVLVAKKQHTELTGEMIREKIAINPYGRQEGNAAYAPLT